jgi:S-adenosylmethionine:tRNA ribosyltransferase-isomerase
MGRSGALIRCENETRGYGPAAVDVADLDYDLPASAIAQVPIEPRDAARLLVDRGGSRPVEHRTVADLPDLLDPGDLLVVNDTRVRRARLRLRKATGGAVEVLLVAPVEGIEAGWEALVRPSRRVPAGTVLTGDDGLAVRVDDDLGDGLRLVVVEGGDPERAGEVPLPPYITTTLEDPERYQTVFARRPGSAAAPTAGLHLTDAVLARCRARGVDVATVELDVGLDTFRPIAVGAVEDHPMHTEAYAVPSSTWDAVASTRAAGGRVVAVGTTVVRSLEAAAATEQLTGRTDLFIRPGYDFAVVDRLLTNFHVPRTTLLALVAAFVGDRWRDLYAEARAEGYRFLSFGDAMLLDRWT